MFMNKKCFNKANDWMNCSCNSNLCNNNFCEYCNMDPIMEKPVEKCVQKDIIHEIQQE